MHPRAATCSNLAPTKMLRPRADSGRVQRGRIATEAPRSSTSRQRSVKLAPKDSKRKFPKRWRIECAKALRQSHFAAGDRKPRVEPSTRRSWTSGEPPAKWILGGSPGATAQPSTAEDPTMTAAATPAFRTEWLPASHPAGINVFGGDSSARWSGRQHTRLKPCESPPLSRAQRCSVPNPHLLLRSRNLRSDTQSLVVMLLPLDCCENHSWPLMAAALLSNPCVATCPVRRPRHSPMPEPTERGRERLARAKPPHRRLRRGAVFFPARHFDRRVCSAVLPCLSTARKSLVARFI